MEDSTVFTVANSAAGAVDRVFVESDLMFVLCRGWRYLSAFGMTGRICHPMLEKPA